MIQSLQGCCECGRGKGVCLEVPKHRQATCSADRVWPLLLRGPTNLPSQPAFLFCSLHRGLWPPGWAWLSHVLTGYSAHLWPPDCSPGTKPSCWGVGVFLSWKFQWYPHLRQAPNSPGWELKAPLPTGQDVSHFPLGGSWLGCPVVNCIVLLYFGTSLGLAEFFWFKCIIPSIQLELNFLGDYAESSARA